MTLFISILLIIVILFGIIKYISSVEQNLAYSKVAVFSEGSQYWSSFEPVVLALLNKGITFTFYTMDKEDPAFKLKHNNIKCVYLGKGALAYYKFNHLKAKLLITTTPNIGAKNYPIKKSPEVETLIHIWHSFGDYAYAWYHKNSLDFYDEIITAGAYMEQQIRFLEKKRNLKQKKVTIGGVPYLDTKLKKISSPNAFKKDKKIVIFAPSWGNKSALWYYGLPLIKQLISDDWLLIIRPHPQTTLSEKNKLKIIEDAVKDDNNVIWDKDPANTDYLAKADLMISDTSSVRLDFAVLYEKPVITLEVPISNYQEYEYADLEPLLKNSTMDSELGAEISAKEIETLPDIITELLKNPKKIDYQLIKNKYATHIGNSGTMIADYIISQIKE